MSNEAVIRKSAILSDCGAYRYELRRTWDDRLPVLLWIGLNPSTADHIQDDPTNRRIAGFSRRWGYGGYVLANLFAYRSPDPKALKQARDPIGPENDTLLGKTLCQRQKNHLRLGQPRNPVESSRRGATAAQQTYRIGRDQGTATAAPALLSSGSATCPV